MAFFRKIFPRSVAAAVLMVAVALPAADAPFAPEVQQRLDLLRTGYENFVLNNTTLPYEAGLKALNERVKPTLERESAAAAQRADLDTLVRIKADLKRLEEGQVLTAVEEAPPAALRHAYSAYKLELSRLESAQKTSLADAKRRYDKGLELVQKELTQAQDVAAALQVKQMREALVEAAAPTVAEVTGKAAGSGGNLLSNGSFDKGLTKWEMTTHERTAEVKMVVDKKVLFHDKPTLRVTNPVLTDTHIAQRVKVRPNTRYRLSGFIKAQDIEDAKGVTAADPAKKVNSGGCLCIAGKYGCKSAMVSTDTWTEVSYEFKTQEETEMVCECRLGYFSATVIGTAWFAEVSLTEVPDSAPPAAAAQAGLPRSAASIPEEWNFHGTLDAKATAKIWLHPNGVYEIKDGGGTQTGTWKPTKDGVTIKISTSTWEVTVVDGVGTMKGETATRYMKAVSK